VRGGFDAGIGAGSPLSNETVSGPAWSSGTLGPACGSRSALSAARSSGWSALDLSSVETSSSVTGTSAAAVVAIVMSPERRSAAIIRSVVLSLSAPNDVEPEVELAAFQVDRQRAAGRVAVIVDNRHRHGEVHRIGGLNRRAEIADLQRVAAGM
jgi:hypothetical protein